MIRLHVWEAAAGRLPMNWTVEHPPPVIWAGCQQTLRAARTASHGLASPLRQRTAPVGQGEEEKGLGGLLRGAALLRRPHLRAGRRPKKRSNTQRLQVSQPVER